MRDDVPLFYPGVFAKALTVTMCVAVVGCVVALRLTGELAVRDIFGTGISALLFAYLVHLWIALGRSDAA